MLHALQLIVVHALHEYHRHSSAYMSALSLIPGHMDQDLLSIQSAQMSVNGGVAAATGPIPELRAAYDKKIHAAFEAVSRDATCLHHVEHGSLQYFATAQQLASDLHVATNKCCPRFTRRLTNKLVERH